eukprot:6993394-Prymnesium_polylepis.1
MVLQSDKLPLVAEEPMTMLQTETDFAPDGDRTAFLHRLLGHRRAAAAGQRFFASTATLAATSPATASSP